MDKPTCSIDGCAKAVHCKGLCPMHYQRLRIHGSLGKPPRRAARVYPACTVEECAAPGNRKGVCEKHYAHAWYEANRERALAAQKEWREANREQYLAKSRAHYAANRERRLADARERYWSDPEKFREKQRRDRLVNPERHRRRKREEYARNRRRYRMAAKARYAADPGPFNERAREYRERNAERLRAAKRRYSRENRLKRNELEMRRRARKRATQIGPVDYDAILAEHGMFCHICSLVIVDKSDLHFDHVMPLSKGGTHTRDNIKPAHALCNIRKGASVA